MNCIIPFESKVKFDTPVSEIASISLEHEITKNESELLGNFIVSGTYKEYDLSMNMRDFKFTIPFTVELTNRIDCDTLDFGIDNFTYELEDREMLVKIDYIVNADDIREEEKYEPVEIIEEPLDLIEEEIILPKEEVQDTNNVQDEEEIRKEIKEEPTFEDEKETLEVENIEENQDLNEEDNSRLNLTEENITSLVATESDFMTYHVHIVKTGETIESISTFYHTDKEEIEKINDISTLNENDKILVPIFNE